MKPGGSETTPITFQEASKRGREEHASTGGIFAYRDEGGGPPSKKYETLTMDHNWVQLVRGSLLGLEAGATSSKKGINTSEHFAPRAEALETEPPEVIADNWFPILREHGHIVECHPDQFMAAEDWVPLYTPEGLWKHLPVALSAFCVLYECIMMNHVLMCHLLYFRRTNCEWLSFHHDLSGFNLDGLPQ